MPSLSFVANESEIAASHQRFVRDAAGARALALKIMRRTEYWIYNPVDGTFSPSKFSGYAGMDFRTYALAKGSGVGGDRFDGGLTRHTISAILGPYAASVELADQLDRWVESTFGPGSLQGIDRDKWRFVRLSTVAAGGLAALAGGWEGSEELVESIAAFPRTDDRPMPDLD